MELDDMKQAWQALDRRISQQMDRRYALDFARFRERHVASARRRLVPLQLGLGLRMVAGVALIVAAAAFWSAHLGTPHLLASGLMLQAYGLLLVGSAAWEMQLVADVDYSQPVVAIQRRLEKVKHGRLRLLPVWIATGCLVWLPATVVLFQAAFGADLVRHAPHVVGWLALSGVLAWLAFGAAGRWLPGAAAALHESSVGGALERSQRALQEIARFEAEA